MAGRRPIPTRLKIIRGNPGKRPIRAEPQLAMPPQVPEDLDVYARAEWERLAAELYRVGLLTVGDIEPFGAYCDAYSRWRTAREDLAKLAADDPVFHGLVTKTAEGNLRRNPLVQIAADAANDMMRHASHLGLTPAARCKLSVADSNAPESKFGPLLVG